MKSYTPLPCPGTQSINIPLKFHCVFIILNFTTANTVIGKKSYLRLNIWWDVIYVQREQQGTKNGALRDTRQNRSPVRFYSIYNNSLLSEAKKRIYPFQCLATNFIAKQFAFKEFMRRCIKCHFKIQYECVNLSSVVQDFSLIIYYRSQLSFTTMSFPECMLPIWQEFIFIKMSHDIVRVTCKVHKSRKPGDNCTQVTCHSSWKGGQIFARDHSFGILPVTIDCWKRWANVGPNYVASSFRTLGWSASGPKALERFKPLRSLITPSLETAISFMKGADLSRSGTLVCSFILNISVNWLLNFSAFSRSDWETSFPFFLLRVEYLGVFFSDYWFTNKSLWVCLNITNQVIHIQIVLFSYISLDFFS